MKSFSDRKICSMQAIDLAKLALGRILFSDKGEAVKLLLNEGEDLNIKSLNSRNLLAVSEIKRNKDGSLDIKLYDMIQAAELMYEIGKEEISNEESGANFLEGFLKSARQLSSSQENALESSQQSDNSSSEQEGGNAPEGA